MTLRILSLLLFLPEIAVHADDFRPLEVQTSDFSGLINQSPFNRTLNLSGSLILTGIAMIDNQQVATLIDTETRETHIVSSDPNRKGWKMLEVQPGRDIETTTAKISVDGQVVNIRYAEVKLKPRESRPAGGGPPAESRSDRRKGDQPGGRRGPPEDIRQKVGALSEEQRTKFFNKMREMHEKNPEMSQEDRTAQVRKVLDKMEKKGGQ